MLKHPQVLISFLQLGGRIELWAEGSPHISIAASPNSAGQSYLLTPLPHTNSGGAVEQQSNKIDCEFLSA